MSKMITESVTRRTMLERAAKLGFMGAAAPLAASSTSLMVRARFIRAGKEIVRPTCPSDLRMPPNNTGDDARNSFIRSPPARPP